MRKIYLLNCLMLASVVGFSQSSNFATQQENLINEFNPIGLIPIKGGDYFSVRLNQTSSKHSTFLSHALKVIGIGTATYQLQRTAVLSGKNERQSKNDLFVPLGIGLTLSANKLDKSRQIEKRFLKIVLFDSSKNYISTDIVQINYKKIKKNRGFIASGDANQTGYVQIMLLDKLGNEITPANFVLTIRQKQHIENFGEYHLLTLSKSFNNSDIISRKINASSDFITFSPPIINGKFIHNSLENQKIKSIKRILKKSQRLTKKNNKKILPSKEIKNKISYYSLIKHSKHKTQKNKHHAPKNNNWKTEHSPFCILNKKDKQTSEEDPSPEDPSPQGAGKTGLMMTEDYDDGDDDDDDGDDDDDDGGYGGDDDDDDDWGDDDDDDDWGDDDDDDNDVDDDNDDGGPYDANGYNANGYDVYGFDKNGYDQYGNSITDAYIDPSTGEPEITELSTVNITAAENSISVDLFDIMGLGGDTNAATINSIQTTFGDIPEELGTFGKGAGIVGVTANGLLAFYQIMKSHGGTLSEWISFIMALLAAGSLLMGWGEIIDLILSVGGTIWDIINMAHP